MKLYYNNPYKSLLYDGKCNEKGIPHGSGILYHYYFELDTKTPRTKTKIIGYFYEGKFIKGTLRHYDQNGRLIFKSRYDRGKSILLERND